MGQASSSHAVLKLCTELTEYYHAYIRNLGPQLFWRNRMVQRSQHPEMQSIKMTLERVFTELTPHLLQEEIILFPYCQKLVLALEKHDKPRLLIESSMLDLESEHVIWIHKMQEVDELAQQLKTKLPHDPVYQAWINQFSDFMTVFKELIYIENEILFPQIRALEKTLYGI